MMDATSLKVYLLNLSVVASSLMELDLTVKIAIGIAAFVYTLAKGINEWKRVFSKNKEEK